MKKRLLASLIVLSVCLGAAFACTSTPSGPRAAPFYPDASCFVVIEQPELLPADHVPIGTQVTYSSNPPSSGPHYPIWADYQEYASPVPRSYYVHDLEHGAIVLLHTCDADAAGCSAIVDGLRATRASLPDDPSCSPATRVRVVISPDPLLAHPVAAAAWGWTYNADCLDLPTLEAFAKDHYAQAPEDLCSNGTTSF